MKTIRRSVLFRPMVGKVVMYALLALVSSCAPQNIGINSTDQHKTLDINIFDGFPDETWSRYEDIEREGWSSSELNKAQHYAHAIGSASAMLVHKGVVVFSWGDVKRKYRVHSIRKSFLFSLYGIHEHEGTIDLDQNIGELGISDKEGLSEVEKQAKIIDLLKCRSGVYHKAAYESPTMAKRRPARHSHYPGEFYYYNNWDFNVLGTIFEQETHTKIFEAFSKRIAAPLHMEDFEVSDGKYVYDRIHSIHPAYTFVMSTRDLARFGLLYLNMGTWKNKQIIDKAWVKRSTSIYSYDWGRGVGFKWTKIIQGYLQAYDTFQTSGYRGHRIMVIPKLEMIFVHRVDTFSINDSVPQQQIENLLIKIISSYKSKG